MSARDSPPVEEGAERPVLPGISRSVGGIGRARGLRRNRLLALAFSAAVHLTVVAALVWLHPRPTPPHAEPSLILVNLVEAPKPEPPGPPTATQAKAAGPQQVVPPPLPHPAVLAVTATPTPDDNSDLLSDSQLAGATGVDGEEAGGGGGGGCDTARVVQQALRRDPLVRSAVEDAHRLGKAVMLWNGDWVRSGEQDGKGLSAVREAIIWELAFAPEACRNQRVHGLVLLSLADGSTRFAIGSGDWRWSDLLSVSAVPSDR